MTKPLLVYFVTGNDYFDDPAWGIDPVFTGPPDELLIWLRAQPNLAELVVATPGSRSVWANQYLAGLTSANEGEK